jgi:hypothetical protein
VTSTSILAVLNLSLVAFSNGYITSIAFTLGTERVEGAVKGKAGSSISFFSIVGIFCGTIFATLVMSHFT